MTRSHCTASLILPVALALALVAPVHLAHGEDHGHGMHHGHHGMHHDPAGEAAMDHSMHQPAMQAPLTRSEAAYTLPDVTLTDAGGQPVALRAELAQAPVLVNFIFTSCTTVCPPMSASFAELEAQLAREGIKARMISISIDPEHDTPARLREYARRFSAGADWRFLTGSQADSVAVQRAFGVYRGNKMSHTPLTLMRTSSDGPWVRLDGFATAAQLATELRRGLAQQAHAAR